MRLIGLMRLLTWLRLAWDTRHAGVMIVRVEANDQD